MTNVFLLDRYTSKYIEIGDMPSSVSDSLKHGEMVIYNSIGLEDSSLSIGVYLGYPVVADRKGSYQKLLAGEDKKYFDEQQKYADKVFPIFKKTFKSSFLGSKPIAARFHIFANQIYFYFYSEERYVFSTYVKELKEKVGKNIFLFQVGARDMVRLSPASKVFLDIDGRPLHASMTWPLPSVSMENIVSQNLDGRDIERLKGWSGKLKESLFYEADLYTEECKKYPEKGTHVKTKSSDIEGVCLSFNIMTCDVTIRTKDNEIYRLPVSQLDFTKK